MLQSGKRGPGKPSHQGQTSGGAQSARPVYLSRHRIAFTGHSELTATTGAEGLEILDRESIALVISDQVMPGMTGVEFLEKVIERNPRAIRMMLTGYADMSSLIRAINEGRIYRYIAKPWEPDELRINVRRALESYELIGENAETLR